MHYLNHTELTDKQIEKINYAIKSVPYYQDNPEIKSYEDLQKVKTYYKDDVRSHWNECVAEGIDASSLRIDYTSGSTGKPFKIGRTEKDSNYSKKLVWKYRNSFLKGALREKHAEFGRNMRWFLQNPDQIVLERGTTLFVKGVLSNETVKEFVRVLNEYQPKWLLGPASFLVQFVEIASKVGNLDIHPAFIENAGEFMYPDSKAYLENFFQCPVVSHYGSREIWPLGLECKHGNMHVVEENALLEVINPNEDGFGEILVSSFQIESMPLIRYHIGDIGRLRKSDCACGNSHTILELIGARMNDYAESREGKRVGAFFFSTIFVDNVLRKGYTGILNWRIVQKDYDLFEISIVKNSNYSYEVEDIVRKYIQEEFTDAKVEYIYVNRIELEKNGKMKYFINEMKH